MTDFTPNGRPLLIGSLPMKDHEDATRLVLDHTPEVPLWVQLPGYKAEGMIEQFLPGMPGLCETTDGSFCIDTIKPGFDEEYLAFFQEWLAVSENGDPLTGSRFCFTLETGRGFAEFLRQVDASNRTFSALKGQITGPFTFTTGLKDQDGRAIFYNDQLKDAAIKKLAMNGQWQAEQFSERGAKPIIFFDEPALAGFGTSEFITISKEAVTEAFNEVFQGVHQAGGLTGVHVCANTEWDLLLNSDVDIISFDAHGYFEKFILYPDPITRFIRKGGILAWGIVPTANSDIINKETADSLAEQLRSQILEIEQIGIQKETVLKQSFITPSCGTGSLDLDSAKTVLKLTVEVSKKIRKML